MRPILTFEVESKDSSIKVGAIISLSSNAFQDIDGNDYSSVEGLGFSWSGWIKPSNSASVVGHIYLGGELCTWNPKRHGRLTGITGV